MIKLKKFYELINRNAVITLIEAVSKKVTYKGSLKDLPDRFDEYGVEDFNLSNEGAFTFKLTAKPIK